MKIAVVQFPGSQCERETHHALARVGLHSEDVLWTYTGDFSEFAGIVIVGGFSYEDRGRSGLIAAKDPLMEHIALQAQQGKPILGICNGAQILVESGLVPGLEGRKLGMSLAENRRIQNGKVVGTGYYNDLCYVKPRRFQAHSVFGRYLTQPMHIPVAHGEGRFVMDPELYAQLEDCGATLWHYSDAEGQMGDEFPLNPNGSFKSLAAVSNCPGNVLAIMPHPERTVAGDVVFRSMKDYLYANQRVKSEALFARPKPLEEKIYQTTPGAFQLVVGSVVSDNTVASIQMVLQRKGIHVALERYSFWEIEAPTTLKQPLIESGQLLNTHKEFEVTQLPQNSTYCVVFKDFDTQAEHICSILSKHGEFSDLKCLKKGVLWKIGTQDPVMIDAIRAEHVLANPFSEYVCWIEPLEKN